MQGCDSVLLLPAQELPLSRAPWGSLSAFPSKSFTWTGYTGMPSVAEALKLLLWVGKKKSTIFPFLTMTQTELCQFTTDKFYHGRKQTKQRDTY